MGLRHDGIGGTMGLGQDTLNLIHNGIGTRWGWDTMGQSLQDSRSAAVSEDVWFCCS